MVERTEGACLDGHVTGSTGPSLWNPTSFPDTVRARDRFSLDDYNLEIYFEAKPRVRLS